MYTVPLPTAKSHAAAHTRSKEDCGVGSRGIAHVGVKEKKGPVCLLALQEGGTEKRVCVGVDKDEDGKNKADAGRRQEEEGGWISCMRRREESPK